MNRTGQKGVRKSRYEMSAGDGGGRALIGSIVGAPAHMAYTGKDHTRHQQAPDLPHRPPPRTYECP